MLGGRNNYNLNSEIVLREAYRLASLVLAEPALMGIADGNHDEPLYRLREDFLEDELVHQLLSLAISNRTRIEHMADRRKDYGDGIFHPSRFPCGSLQPDCEVIDRVPLTFLESCHKIIHARNIVAQAPGAPEDVPLKMEITLRGKKDRGGNDWVAHLNLLEFIQGTVHNFDGRQ